MTPVLVASLLELPARIVLSALQNKKVHVSLLGLVPFVVCTGGVVCWPLLIYIARRVEMRRTPEADEDTEENEPAL